MRRALILALLVFSTAAICQSPPPANYDEAKVGTYTLPDPLVFADGKRVRSARDWPRRRAEILRVFEDDVFGQTPAAKPIRYEVFDVDRAALDGAAIRKQITIYFSDRSDGPREDVLLYIPAGSHQPPPVILSLNFRGNQAVTADPAVRLPIVWDPRTHEPHPASPDTRGTDTQFDVTQTLARGYAFATIYYQQIEPDYPGGYRDGLRSLFFKTGQTEPGPDDWGSIGAWSYGLSRALDYLEKDKDVDAKRVAVMGHSRLGKAVLWAGAQDPRFAMVIANCPGEGGASLARRNYGETVESITRRYGYWFARNFARFADDPNQLPVDMHELLVLIAPRPLYVNGAEEDRWADPKGEFLAMVAAGPVYRLLGARDLGTDQMPGLNAPILHTLGFHYRPGKHDVLPYDWQQFLAFADLHLKRH